MTPEIEAQLLVDLGAIKAGITSLNENLKAHTEQDMDQFAKMTETVAALSSQVAVLIKDQAVYDALKESQERAISKRATIVGSIAGFVSSAVLTWLQIHFTGGK